MSGDEVKKILAENNQNIAGIARKMGITRQSLNSKLKASDIGVGLLQEIAKAANIPLYKLIPELDANTIVAEKSPGYGKGIDAEMVAEHEKKLKEIQQKLDELNKKLEGLNP